MKNLLKLFLHDLTFYRNFFLIFILVTGVCWVIWPSSVDAQTLTLQTSIDMRKGPGAYYPLVLRLNSGAQINPKSSEEGWVEVAVDEHKGWIPERIIKNQSRSESQDNSSTKSSRNKKKDEEGVSDRMNEMFDDMNGDKSTSESSSDKSYVSPAQVSAGVKGFARKFTSRHGQTTVELTKDFENRININEYRRFKQKRVGQWDQQLAQNRFPLVTDTIPAMTPGIEKMGWGIANVMAQKGLVKDRELLEYLNYLALIVAESSHRYEIPIQIHVLDTDEVTGYAVPNGIIFVSRGALKMIENEAEYAFFIAHELSHIVLQHGVKEIRKRMPKIKADKAFSEMEDELNYDERQDEEVVQTSQDLTKMANKMYEYVISKKLETYEHEADYWGMVYTYRAGYRPSNSIDLIKRIYNEQGDFENKIGKVDWQGASIKERIKNCRENLDKFDQLRNTNSEYAGEWDRHTDDL